MSGRPGTSQLHRISALRASSAIAAGTPRAKSPPPRFSAFHPAQMWSHPNRWNRARSPTGRNKGGKENAPGRAGKRRQVPAAPPGAHTRTTAGRGLPHAHPTPQPDPPWPCDEPRPTGAPPARIFRSPYIATPGRVQEVGLVGGNARSGGRQAGGESLCPLRVDRQVGGVAPSGAEICGGPATTRGNSRALRAGRCPPHMLFPEPIPSRPRLAALAVQMPGLC